MESSERKKKPNCSHCRGTQYVFAYWLERVLDKQGMHLTDIQADVFTLIPVEYFIFCHCNPRIVLLNREFTSCANCEGTTRRFSEVAEHRGYFGRKIRNFHWQVITKLPSRYFERCSCDENPKPHEERQFLEVVLEILGNAPALYIHHDLRP